MLDSQVITTAPSILRVACPSQEEKKMSLFFFSKRQPLNKKTPLSDCVSPSRSSTAVKPSLAVCSARFVSIHINLLSLIGTSLLHH